MRLGNSCADDRMSTTSGAPDGAQRRHVAVRVAVEQRVQGAPGVGARGVAERRRVDDLLSVIAVAVGADCLENNGALLAVAMGAQCRRVDEIAHFDLALCDEVRQVLQILVLHEFRVAVAVVAEDRLDPARSGATQRAHSLHHAGRTSGAILAAVIPAVTVDAASGALFSALAGALVGAKRADSQFLDPVLVEPTAAGDRGEFVLGCVCAARGHQERHGKNEEALAKGHGWLGSRLEPPMARIQTIELRHR